MKVGDEVFIIEGYKIVTAKIIGVYGYSSNVRYKLDVGKFSLYKEGQIISNLGTAKRELVKELKYGRK